MKIISFNVNSIRSRFHQIDAVIEKYSPDIICLQETKVTDSEFPVEEIQKKGYYSEFVGQKTHYGVAILSKNKAIKVFKGLDNDELDAQKRAISIEYEYLNEKYLIINSYFPQGENLSHQVKFPFKKKYYSTIFENVKQYINDYRNILICGDMNIAYRDEDIGIGEENANKWLKTGKCSFLPEEREWFQKIMNLGFYDTYLLSEEKNEKYSWFDYRSFGFEKDPKRGLRIDFVLCSENLNKSIKNSGIDYEIRGMEKPSDHCPIWVELLPNLIP